MSPRIFALFVLPLAALACAHSYELESSEGLAHGPILPRDAGILAGLPLDGQDVHLVYAGSGQLTTDAIVAALSPYTAAVEAAETPETREEYEAGAREAGLRYVVFPEILTWKDRNTRRWGLPDLLEVRLTLSDAESGEILDTTTIHASSRIEPSWDDRPQDLLRVPLERYASNLFEGR